MYHNFFSISLILAWMVTPESLNLVNRASGMAGLPVILFLGAGFGLSLVSGLLIHSPKIVKAGYNSDYKILSHVYGKSIGMAALFSGRLPLLLFVSTGMLVTAGFAFNEIFLYWFPNFLFAFILLILVAILYLIGAQYVRAAQSIFVTLAITGLLTLIALGFVGQSMAPGNSVGQQKIASATLFAMGCIPFLGFDFHASKQGPGMVIYSLLGGFVLLVLWVVTVMKFAVPELLAESTIARMTVARSIAGETGRYLMGGVVIFGVLAGANGLFFVVRNIFADLAEEKIFPERIKQNWLVILVLSATIGLMMMSGFAGEQILEEQIKASIILWLFYLSLRSSSAGVLLGSRNNTWKVLGCLIGAAYFIAGLVLITTSDRMEYILGFIVMVFAAAAAFSFIWTKIYSNKTT